jgi:hypothetical protein
MQQYRAEWVCPNCDRPNKTLLQGVPRANMQLVTCDPDDGGCDSTLVLEVEIAITTKVHAVPALDRQRRDCDLHPGNMGDESSAPY